MTALPRGLAVRRDAGLYGYERALRRAGLDPVAGVDEAGRGACAGPLVAAAVVLPDGRPLTYADCGVNPTPDPGQLASIGIDAADNHRFLTGQEPLVAFLSFSTKGSADHPAVDTVREAVALAQGAVLGLVAAGLAHEPDGRERRGLATTGLQEFTHWRELAH